MNNTQQVDNTNNKETPINTIIIIFTVFAIIYVSVISCIFYVHYRKPLIDRINLNYRKIIRKLQKEKKVRPIQNQNNN